MSDTATRYHTDAMISHMQAARVAKRAAMPTLARWHVDAARRHSRDLVRERTSPAHDFGEHCDCGRCHACITEEEYTA